MQNSEQKSSLIPSPPDDGNAVLPAVRALMCDCQRLISWYNSRVSSNQEKLSALIENIEKRFSVAREEIESDVANLINKQCLSNAE